MNNIVFVGGGTGISSILKGLLKIQPKEIEVTAIISMFDSGGSSGKLREDFNTLPMGDVRQVMLSMATNEMMKSIFSYRFPKSSSIDAHNLGNLIITALSDIYDSPKKAFKVTNGLLGCDGNVLPVTWDDAQIEIEYENKIVIRGENLIDDLYLKGESSKVKSIRLSPSLIKVSDEAFNALKNADIIVFGPGDLYCSVICNFLTIGFTDAISKSSAQLVYIPNLVNKAGQTDNFTINDYCMEIEKYLKHKLDIILVNTEALLPVTEKRYRKYMSLPPVDNLSSNSYKVIRKELLDKTEIKVDKNDSLFRGFARHDSNKVLTEIFALLQDI